MKNLIGFLLLLLLLGAAYWVYTNNGFSSKENPEILKDFAVKDTADIDQIFLSQPNGKKILITRRDEKSWMANHQFNAREDAINLILRTIHDIQIQSAVPNVRFDAVVRNLATSHTKVEIYMGKKEPSKVWYIGEPSPSRLGTYMLLEEDGKKSSKPFVTHLIMERGFLGTRFFLDADLWRNPLVMECKPKEIKSIEVWHNNDTAIGFKMVQEAKDQFKIQSHQDSNWVDVSQEDAIPYFREFSAIHYEYIDNKTKIESLDSIYQSPYREKIEIKMQDGKKIILKTFYMPVAKGSTLGGEPIYYHPEKMYAFSTEMSKTVHPIVQNLTFDKLTADYRNFAPSTIVEK